MRKERQQVAIKIYRQLWNHPKPRRGLVFVQGKMINIIPAGLDVLLCFPVSLVLLDSDINTYSSRRGRRVDLESAEHSIVEVASVLGASASPDSCSGVILALILV